VTQRAAPAVADELRDLVAERGTSLRRLADDVGVSQAHLTRIIQRKKEATPDLAQRVALALDLSPDYFAEVREGAVIDAVRRDPQLRERLYRQITKR
jgi:plasmid maintenance system antidote protein VapI